MRIRLCLCLAILVSVAAIVYSQGSTAPQTQGRLEVNVVQVPLIVTVTDNKGQLVTTLGRQDFRVYEDNRLQKIDSFSRESDLPLSIALLIDQSSSTIDKLDFERSAAIDFFASTVKRKKDRAMVIGFSSDAHLLVDFTDDTSALSEGLKKLEAGGGTAIFDALYLTAQQKLSQEVGERRKLIILISDGEDTASRYTLPQALERVQKNDVLIYAISINRIAGTKAVNKEQGDKAIQQMVNETGGRAYFPSKLSELSAEFKKIETELRSQYTISYTPTNPFNGTYRKIRIETVDKKYKPRTRAGYIASKNKN
jgi:VWFA-related protein